MKNDYQIWNILHDGALVEVKGDIPGDLTIKVERIPSSEVKGA